MSNENTSNECSLLSTGYSEILKGATMTYWNEETTLTKTGTEKVIQFFSGRCYNDQDALLYTLFQKDLKPLNYGYNIGGEMLSNQFGAELNQNLMTTQINELKINSDVVIIKRVLSILFDSSITGIFLCIVDILVENNSNDRINKLIEEITARGYRNQDLINQNLFSLYRKHGEVQSEILIKSWNEESLNTITQEWKNNLQIKIIQLPKESDTLNQFNILEDIYKMSTEDIFHDFYDLSNTKISEHLKSEPDIETKDHQQPDYENFVTNIKLKWASFIKNQIMDNLKSLLREIFTGVALEIKDILLTISYKIIRLFYENSLRKRFEKIVEEEKEPREDYYKNLVILMGETTDPELHADIIRKNSPCDMLCVQAASNILKRKINVCLNNLYTTKMTVLYFHPTEYSNDHSIDIEHCVASDTDLAILEKIDHIPDEVSNCQKFRESVAKHISDNASQNIITALDYNWNRYSTSKGLIGGVKPHQKIKIELEDPIKLVELDAVVSRCNFLKKSGELSKYNLNKNQITEVKKLIDKFGKKELYFYVESKILKQGKLEETDFFRIDAQSSTREYDNYQIQRNGPKKDGEKTSICGILIKKPINDGQCYKIKREEIKNAFNLGLTGLEDCDMIEVIPELL